MAEQRNRQKAKQKAEHNTQPHCLIEKELTTEPAKKTYRRYFDVTADALFRLSFNVRIYASPEKADELEALVQSNIDTVAKDFAAERSRLKKLMKDNGISASVSFPHSTKVQAKVSSPSAGKLLGVISELDALVGDITNLWLHGILDNRQYTQGIYKCQRQAVKMTGRLRQLWFDTRKLMQGTDDVQSSETSATVEVATGNAANQDSPAAKKTAAKKVTELPAAAESTAKEEVEEKLTAAK